MRKERHHIWNNARETTSKEQCERNNTRSNIVRSNAKGVEKKHFKT